MYRFSEGKMVWLTLLITVMAVARAQNSSSRASKVQALEKQVKILTDLVHAQSNIMSRFTCDGGVSDSNPESECILKVANQAKKIAKLEGDLESLGSFRKRKEKFFQQLQTNVPDLSKNLKILETKLISLDSKQAADVSSLRADVQSVLRKTNKLTNSVNQRGTKVQQTTDTDQWPSGSYCILASGSCPEGFSLRSGHMKAISMYRGTPSYIKQETFGDSKIKCHGRCGQHGSWTGELYINACCK